MQQTHCYATGTVTLLWKCNMVHRSCHQGNLICNNTYLHRTASNELPVPLKCQLSSLSILGVIIIIIIIIIIIKNLIELFSISGVLMLTVLTRVRRRKRKIKRLLGMVKETQHNRIQQNRSYNALLASTSQSIAGIGNLHHRRCLPANEGLRW
jgi:hypothetical protein